MFFESRKKRKLLKQPLYASPSAVCISPPPPYSAQPVPCPPPAPGPYHFQAPPPCHPAASQIQFSMSPPPRPVFYQQPQPHQWTSCLNLPTDTSCPIVNSTARYYNRGIGLYDEVAEKFSDVISLIDEDKFSGNEKDLAMTLPPELPLRGGDIDRSLFYNQKPSKKPSSSSQGRETNVFSKLDFYLNSTLPVSLPPLRVYLPTYPLLCLAAQYSQSAYLSPQSSGERKDFVSADGRLGTKAMVIKSVPCDDKKTIVFAIRGTSVLSIRDWGVNLSTDPVTASGFLDDPGNLCHSGFLRVAKAMVRPIAARLQHLLEENPNRASCSLLITGHSAGGAVASLLYAHMLSKTIHSELTVLTDCFKRVHCITFGAPPVSLLPLQKDGSDDRHRKCLFHSIINEGDPVVRADKGYVRSLVDLLSAPVPTGNTNTRLLNSKPSLAALGASMSRLDLTLKPQKTGPQPKTNSKPSKHTILPSQKLWWDVPPATLSNAGRLVVLRVAKGKKESDTVTASIVTDEQLRQVIFGDPIMHQMEVYRRRIEALAVRAVTGRLGCDGVIN